MSRVLKGEAAISAGSTRLPAPAAAHVAANVSAAPCAAPATPSPAPTAAELEALRLEARRQGFEQGQRDAATQANAALARIEGQWLGMIERIDGEARARLQALETLGVAVAFEACARVLGEASVDAAGVGAAVRQLLAQAQETALLRVQLAPRDLAAVEAIVSADPHWQQRALRFEADPALRAGECRVVTGHGQLETDLATQLAAISAALLAACADGRDDAEASRR